VVEVAKLGVGLSGRHWRPSPTVERGRGLFEPPISIDDNLCIRFDADGGGVDCLSPLPGALLANIRGDHALPLLAPHLALYSYRPHRRPPPPTQRCRDPKAHL
jgi:hypothetical protein